MHPALIVILIFGLVVLAHVVFPSSAPFLVVVILSTSWYLFLKQSEHEAWTEQDMYSTLDRGVTYAEQGDYQKALEDFNFVLNKAPRILRKFPYTAETYFNRGNTYYLLGNFSNAIKDYCQAIRLKPGYIDGYINRGVAYADQGHHQEALKDYERAIQLTPDLPVVYYNWGNTYQALDDYERAIERYTHAIRLSPGHVYAHNGRGISHQNLGNYAQAIEDYSQVLQLKLDNAEDLGLSRSKIKNVDVFNNRGSARCYLGNNKQSLEDFSQVTNLQPSANAYYNQAIVQKLLDMNDEAISSLDKALNLDASCVPAYYCRGNIHYDADNQQSALADFQQAMALETNQVGKIDPDDGHGFYERGLARYRIGDREGAITGLEQAAQVCQKLRYLTFYQKVIQTLAEIQPKAES